MLSEMDKLIIRLAATITQLEQAYNNLAKSKAETEAQLNAKIAELQSKKVVRK